MKMLFLTPRDSKTNLGGVERHVKLLAEELVRRGHQVKELSLDEVNKSYKDYKNYKEGEKGEKDQKDKKGEGKFQKDGKVGKFWAWRYLWERRELLRWAEVAHVHDVFWWVMPFLPMIRWNKGYKDYKSYKGYKRDCHGPPAAGLAMTKTKVFVTFHGWEGRYPPTWVAVWQKRLAARLCDGTIGVGNFFEKWYGVKTDRVVWGAIGEKIKNIEINKDLEKRGKRLRIVFFGRLEKVNGIDLVIESMKKIVAPAVRLLSSEASGLAPESVATAGFGRASGFLQGKNPGPSEEEVNGIEIMIEAAKKLNKSYKEYKDYKDRPGRHLETSSRSHPVLFIGDGSWRKQAERVGRVTGMVAEPWKYLADADIVIASSYLAILEAAAMGKKIIAVENNPLKRDYLEGHPLSRYFKIVGSTEELVGEIRDKSYKNYKDYKEGERGEKDKDQKGEGNTWALGQTAEKLADEYEKLWKIV